MMLGLKYKYLFPPKVTPFQFIFLERRESVGGVLSSFLEKRVIDSDFFTSQKKKPKSGGNWKGKNLFGPYNYEFEYYVFGK